MWGWGANDVRLEIDLVGLRIIARPELILVAENRVRDASEQYYKQSALLQSRYVLRHAFLDKRLMTE